MKKSHIVTLLIFLLVIPATLFFGLRLSGRAYYFTSTLVIAEILVPFLLAFENRKPQARELVVIAVLSALAVAARVVIPIPNFKAIFAVIMLSGIAFGPEAGFLVGAVSAFTSNFFYGQGAYTPWQMFAYGAGGMLAGFLFAKGRLPRKPVVMGIFGFLTMLCFVGPLLDTCSVFLTLPVINLETVWPLYMSGFPVNLSQGVCTFLTILLFGNALLEKLDRVKVQYGMTEDEDGL
ncbi:MAG: ECF transporter S component [Candidatus Faecousia sp.]|nr:ECF transporter S component [Candidatus Faecousia sp.]